MVNAPPITTLSVPLIEASVSSVSRPPATTRRPFVAPGNVSAPVVCKRVVEVVSTPVIVTVSPRSTTLPAIPSLPTV